MEDHDFGELVIRQSHLLRGMILLELDRLSNAAEADAVAEVVSAHKNKLSLARKMRRSALWPRQKQRPLKGDGPAALRYVKSAGAWSLKSAEKIGVALAIEALKKATMG